MALRRPESEVSSASKSSGNSAPRRFAHRSYSFSGSLTAAALALLVSTLAIPAARAETVAGVTAGALSVESSKSEIWKSGDSIPFSLALTLFFRLAPRLSEQERPAEAAFQALDEALGTPGGGRWAGRIYLDPPSPILPKTFLRLGVPSVTAGTAAIGLC